MMRKVHHMISNSVKQKKRSEMLLKIKDNHYAIALYLADSLLDYRSRLQCSA